GGVPRRAGGGGAAAGGGIGGGAAAAARAPCRKADPQPPPQPPPPQPPPPQPPHCAHAGIAARHSTSAMAGTMRNTGIGINIVQRKRTASLNQRASAMRSAAAATISASPSVVFRPASSSGLRQSASAS